MRDMVENIVLFVVITLCIAYGGFWPTVAIIVLVPLVWLIVGIAGLVAKAMWDVYRESR